MATHCPVSVFLANFTLAKVPSPRVFPSSYFPTRVLILGDLGALILLWSRSHGSSFPTASDLRRLKLRSLFYWVCVSLTFGQILGGRDKQSGRIWKKKKKKENIEEDYRVGNGWGPKKEGWFFCTAFTRSQSATCNAEEVQVSMAACVSWLFCRCFINHCIACFPKIPTPGEKTRAKQGGGDSVFTNFPIFTAIRAQHDTRLRQIT